MPPPRTLEQMNLSSLLTGAAGLALAFASAGLPVYVHLHQDQFGPPRMQYASVDLAGGAGEAETRTARFEEMPAASSDSFSDGAQRQSAPAPLLDSVVTGAVSLPGRRPSQTFESPPFQPFPGGLKTYQVIYAANGRALVVDEGVIEMVRANSVLSDGSTVLSIQNSGPQWQVVTTGSRILKWTAQGL